MEEYKELSHHLSAIIETAIDGIITIDSKGEMQSVNHAVERLFGYKKEELIGKNVSMLMPHPHRHHHDHYIENYLHTRIPKIIGIGREVEGLKKNGEHFPFNLAVSEVVLNNRILFTGIIHDLSDTKEAQKQLKEMNLQLESKISKRTDELEAVINRLIKTNRKLVNSEKALQQALQAEKEANELKSKFVSTASHEFRTPLSTILSSASLIGKYTKGEQQDKRLRHISKIKNSVNHLTGILNDFLDLSKLEEGRVEIKSEDVNLKNLINDVFFQLDGIRKIDQEMVLEMENNIELSSDRNTLKNILFNLLSNAIKFSDKGKITVSVKESEKHVQIDISDQGIGIPEVDKKYLFERFFRAGNVENIKGTGLGLSIVKHYVSMLKGKITFESQEKKGTTFNIVIPKYCN